MQIEKHNNEQRAPTEVPKTRQHRERSTKTVLGCQKTNGINPRSAIIQQQHNPKRRITIKAFVVDNSLNQFLILFT